jgi:hypothetical protein
MVSKNVFFLGIKKTFVFVLLIMFFFFVSSCDENFLKKGLTSDNVGVRVAKESMNHLGEVLIDFNGKKYDFDCSGFIRFVFIQYAGVDLDKYIVKQSRSKVEAYYNTFKIEVEGKLRIMPGDLIFFDNTYDRNRNGVMDDELTHIALVIGYDRESGSIVFINKSKGKPVSLGYINFNYPDRDYVIKEGKNIQVNSYVRDDKLGKLLSTQAFRGFGRIPLVTKN